MLLFRFSDFDHSENEATTDMGQGQIGDFLLIHTQRKRERESDTHTEI